MRNLLLLLLSFSLPLYAQCPGEDAEPAVAVKTAAGPTVFICGFEDREVPKTKGKRAFQDFSVFYTLTPLPVEPPAGSKPPASPPAAAAPAQKVFTAESADTYWAKEIKGKGLELEELWFFSDKPQAALKREVTCTKEACQVSEAKCVLKMKPNPFPKALPEFQKKLAAGTLKDDGEELIDRIFAQAFTGDTAAKEFYAKEPTGLDPALTEAFTANRKKLEEGCKR